VNPGQRRPVTGLQSNQATPHAGTVDAAVPGDWIVPDWPVPANVGALITTRSGGVSTGPWGAPVHEGDGMNLSFAVGDAAGAVAENRARLAAWLPAPPRWLRQVHGGLVVDAERSHAAPAADASVATTAGVVSAVLIADCLPVLLAEARGRAVAAAHAGWRGLAAGVIQNAVARLRQRLDDPGAEVLAFLGPAIGPRRFEVGGEVAVAMARDLPQSAVAFVAAGDGKYLADLFELARQALSRCGVEAVFGGGLCTVSDPTRFYSYRRDRVTGRHAAAIWLRHAARA
jgi:YfiH family protein